MERCPICNSIGIIKLHGLQPTQEDDFIVANHGIIDWYDPPMCPRFVQIIPGLLRSMNDLQGQVQESSVQARRLKMMLVFSWCGVNLLDGTCLNCTYSDGKPVTCCGCEGPLKGRFCSFCASRNENSFAYDSNSNYFNNGKPVTCCGRDVLFATRLASSKLHGLQPTQEDDFIVANHGIIDWYDPPMCPRSVQIIPGLLRSMNDLQGQVQESSVQAKRLKMMLVFSWALVMNEDA
ncbi:hypothetical protein Tco_0489595 [Tanacetum coccineum]